VRNGPQRRRAARIPREGVQRRKNHRAPSANEGEAGAGKSATVPEAAGAAVLTARSQDIVGGNPRIDSHGIEWSAMGAGPTSGEPRDSPMSTAASPGVAKGRALFSDGASARVGSSAALPRPLGGCAARTALKRSRHSARVMRAVPSARESLSLRQEYCPGHRSRRSRPPAIPQLMSAVAPAVR